MRVLVLGAGFGGLQLASRLSDELGEEADVVLIDKSDGFVMGSSKLDVMFGHTTVAAVRHSYSAIAKLGVRFVQSTIRSIDPIRRTVETDAGSFTADVLVVALGADLDPDATPGLAEAGIDYYTPAGAFAARDALQSFGGGKVIVGVTSTPFKCPPAPSETALMMHDFLTERGLRETSEIALVMPLPSPIPPSPEASQAVLDAFGERGITWCPNREIRRLDPERRVAVLADGEEMPFDLYLGVPKHRVPTVVAESGMCVDGWVPVDPLTLETRFPDVYAVGDVTSVGGPKAGAFSERQADVVADRLIARHHGRSATSSYDGNGVCYVEFGHGSVARVEVTFRSGERPTGTFDQPSEQLIAEKADFGTTRLSRWFGTSSTQ